MLVDIAFLGTGTAEDPLRRNTAYLITDKGSCTGIQVDAGYNVYEALCEHIGSQETLAYRPDITMLTHQHGDHTGSLSRQLLSMWRACETAGITRDYIITGEPGALNSVYPSMELAYPGFMDKLIKKRVRLHILPMDDMKSFGSLGISHAPTDHSAPNYAYRFDADGSSFAISGDGKLTPESRRLFDGVDLLCHEGFMVEGDSPTHESIANVLEYARSAGIRRVAIVHVDAPERTRIDEIKHYRQKAMESGIDLWLPEDDDSVPV